MAKKGAKQSSGLIRKEPKVSAEVILSHPVFKEMANRLETVQRMLKDLPAAIGAAVAETMRKPPDGASGPPVPLINPKTVEIHLNKLIVDGKTSITGDAKRIEKPRVIEKTLLDVGGHLHNQPNFLCSKCDDTGIFETGNDDVPCSCPAGEKALFNVAGVDQPVSGAEMKRHLFNSSPEPLTNAAFNAKRKRPQ